MSLPQAPTNLDAAARAEALSYKLRKEAFVSNLSGSSLMDINAVTLVAASSLLLYTALTKRGIISPLDRLTNYTVDFLLNVCAILFAFTIYASAPGFLNFLLVGPAVVLLVPWPGGKRKVRRDGTGSGSGARAGKGGVATAMATSVDANGRSAVQGLRSRNNDSDEKSTNSESLHQSQSQSLPPSLQLTPGTLLPRPFLTTYRGALLIATTLAILAVDFPIFPRRLAKVETWGTSMMDLGVGNFVFSAGVVGARSVIRKDQGVKLGKDEKKGEKGGMLTAFRHSLPLIILGVARLISVKGLEYAEHVTEYGVHWNFFFTLALLPPFVEGVDRIVDGVRAFGTEFAAGFVTCDAVADDYNAIGYVDTSISTSTRTSDSTQSRQRWMSRSYTSVRYDLAALLISMSYEIVLGTTSLLSFILISPRTPASSLLSKNREGVFSFAGYLAIFLAGRSTGILTCQFHAVAGSGSASTSASASASASKSKGKGKEKGTGRGKGKNATHQSPLTTHEKSLISHERTRIILPSLLARAIVYATLYLAITNVYSVNLTVSRRLANLPYVLWTVGYNNAMLFLFAGIEALGRGFVYSRHKMEDEDKDEDEIGDAGEVLALAQDIPSPILRAFNRNGLAVFLVANLLTGLVNLSVNTLDMGRVGAMGVLMGYAAGVCVVAVGMDVWGVKVKL